MKTLQIKYRDVLTILTILLPAILTAQITVKGAIIDELENPIEMANIVLLDSSNKILKGVISDNNGKFSLHYNQTGKFHLEVSCVGYQSAKFEVDKTTNLGVIKLKQDNSLDEVIITSSSGISLKKENGKFVTNVQNTSFENTNSVWEGLKQVPLINVDDNSFKVNNKDAIIEINGVQTQMSGADLGDYLKSLSPNTIKKIEINATPNVSYGSEVNAVINIITQNKLNNYRLGVNFSNGFRTKYYNNENVYFYLNTSKINIYTNYSYGNLPKINTATITQRILKKPEELLNYKENNNQKKHNLSLNITLSFKQKNTIDLTNVYSFRKTDLQGVSKNETFNKNIFVNSKNKIIQLTQTWKHKVNDSTAFKLGFYEVFKNFKTESSSTINNMGNVTQQTKSEIPLFIGFFDYSTSNKLGIISLGLKYNDTRVKDDNIAFFLNQKQSSPYRYNEKIVSLYANQQIKLAKGKDISIGIRSESSIIDYSFFNAQLNKNIVNKINYTDILYNVNYNWFKKWYNAISFRKQISRPNYSYLNPFKSANSDITLFGGNINVSPMKHYSLSYQAVKGKIAFYIQSGLMKDFISTINELENNTIVSTYRNFDKLFYNAVGMYIRESFFNNKWTTSNGINYSYYLLKDNSFNEIGSATPVIDFTSNNIIKLGKKTNLNINYNVIPSYYDGLINHYTRHNLGFNISKKMRSFSISLFAKDIFKTQTSSSKTSFKNFLYQSNYYGDNRLFGFSLRWNLTGKAYKDKSIKEIKDDSIDRLER